MAQKYFKAGSQGPFLYDDASYNAFETDGQGKILQAPTEAEHVVRLIDLSSPPPAGFTGTVKVVTNSQITGGALEVKTKLLTYIQGCVTTVGAESGWTATPL